MFKRMCLLLCVVVGLLFCFEGQLQANQQDTVEKIQAQLLKQSWSIMDRETVPDRDARSRLMAKSLSDAAFELKAEKKFSMASRWLIAATIAIWWHETRFSLEVHRGGLSRWGSDDGQAKCFGQLHERAVGIEREPGEPLPDFRVRQRQTWEALSGTDYESTKACARATMLQLLAKLKCCVVQEKEWQERWMGAFGDYGTGGCSCTPVIRKDNNSSEDRLRTMLRIVVHL